MLIPMSRPAIAGQGGYGKGTPAGTINRGSFSQLPRTGGNNQDLMQMLQMLFAQGGMGGGMGGSQTAPQEDNLNPPYNPTIPQFVPSPRFDYGEMIRRSLGR